ncbi:MAG: peptidoglycan DD-metalloendopeptidase family protein [Ilumatobacteraceae bacterium]
MAPARPGGAAPIRAVAARSMCGARRSARRAAATVVVLVAGATMPLGPLSVLSGGSVSIVSADDAAAQAAREIADAQDRANAAADAYFAAVSALDSLAVETDSLEAEVAALEQEMDALGARVQAIAVKRFTRAGSNQSSPLLNGFASAEQQMQLSAFADVIDDNSENDLDEYESLSRDLSAKQRDLENTKNAVEEQASAAVELRDTALAEVENLKKVEAQRLADERVRAALEAERRARAASESQRSNRSSGASPSRPVSFGGSGWVCPTGDAYVGFSDTWGAPRSGGRTHEGVDMIGARGTPILAVVSGFAKPNYSDLGGNGVWFRGSDGNAYFYAHLDSYAQLGNVSAGTVIGYMGDTGNAKYSTPHLHFEIHPGGGAAVNPYPTVRANC